MANRTITNSFFWAAIETYSSQGIMFIVSVIMARLLMPEDYGVLGIISVFIAISETFVDSGFTNALINRKDCTQDDYSTVYFFNIIISIVFFFILFISAPLIAAFYDNGLLLWTTRAMGLTFVISSLSSIHLTILTKGLKFKVKACITLIVSIFSGIGGILMAYSGFGVWALVWQAILAAGLKSAICIFYLSWWPTVFFSKASFRELFGYGSKLLGSNIIQTLYNNIYNLVIGKAYNAAELGYFTRADGYSRLIPINISGVLNKILLPILSLKQDDDLELINLHRTFIIVTSYFIFPGCLFLAGFASPLVHIMISDKWMPIVPILQILCVAGIFDHFSSINGNFILAKGKAVFFIRMHTFTKPIGVLILAISIIWDIEIVALGKVVYSIICMFAGYYFLKKCLQIHLRESLIEILKLFLISSVLAYVVYIVFGTVEYKLINLMIIGFAAFSAYVLLTYVMCNDTVSLVLKILKKNGDKN